MKSPNAKTLLSEDDLAVLEYNQTEPRETAGKLTASLKDAEKWQRRSVWSVIAEVLLSLFRI